MADIVLKITPTTITDLTVKMPDGGAYVTYTLADVVDMTDWLELEMPCDTDGKVFIESTGYVSQSVTFQSANNPYTIDLVEATDDVANLSDSVNSYSVKDKQARFEIDMLKNTKQEKLLEGTGISIGTNGVGQQEIAANPDQTYNPTSTNAQSGVAVAGLLEAIYPVGSVYIGTQTTCPMSTVMSGTTWTLVSSGKALWTGDGTAGSGTTTNANFANAPANTTIAAGLPNITGNIENSGSAGGFVEGSGTGCFTDTTNYAKMKTHSASNSSYDTVANKLVFNASNSNSIYGKSTTVQPPAYVVNVWRRTA